MLGEGFNSEEIVGHLEFFAFVRWYVDEEVSLDSSQEAERLVGLGCKVRLMDLQ